MTIAQPPGDIFNQRVDGTWGEFRSPAGRVTYVMTNARLGEATGSDLEHRLTRHLRPVREVLDVKGMSFDQLLQRDLDDHRVASELVPYLLGQAREGVAPTGPAFFPPILAVLLPDDVGDNRAFPAAEVGNVVRVEGLPFTEDRFGDRFVFRRMLLDGEDPQPADLHPIRFGRLDWSDDKARLVVIDGQHRAMALLAIERTRRGTWDETSAARYKHFYETRVGEALSEGVDFTVQVPVTICWFPDLVDSTSSPVQAARKLFVDVNRNAKRPSDDRVVLLSDDDLLNSFTQRFLNLLPRDGAGLPLYAVEYDSPVTHRGPGRWPVLTTLQALRTMIEHLVFGPAKYVQSVDEEMRGRPPEDDGSFMRRQLNIENVLPAVIPDEGELMQRGAVKRKRFPRSRVHDLQRAFASSWGEALLNLLTLTEPYRAHAQALGWLHQELPSTTAVEQLAREAIFEGVGMYWTLNDSANSWSLQRRTDPDLRKTDVVLAWDAVQAAQRRFAQKRGEIFLGSVTDGDVRRSDHVFNDVFKTLACQLGLALTFGTIAHVNGTPAAELPPLAARLAGAINDAMLSSSSQGLDRRLAFAKVETAPDHPTINSIIRMDTARAIQFRYFWLELLLVGDATARLRDVVDVGTLERQRDRARSRFLTYRVSEQIRSLKALSPTAPEDTLRTKASLQVTTQLADALEDWFDVPKTDFERWVMSEDDFSLSGSRRSDEDEDEDVDADED